MQTKKTNPRFSKVKLTYVLLILGVLSVGSVYGFHLFTLYRAAQIEQPQLQADRLIRDLRRYERQMQRFPASFHEINQLIWHTQPQPDYGRAGKQAHTKNYYYVYQRIEDDKCVLWALPIGPRRELASSYYFVIAPHWLKVWKGAAMTDEQIARLPVVPTPDELAGWSLHEIAGQQRRIQ